MVKQDYQGICFATEQTDARPWLVLVHGLGMHQDMWQWQIPALSGEYRILIYDLYGHGQSKPGPKSPSLTQFSQQLMILLDYLKIQTCIMIGFSLGGMIVRHFALHHQERLHALIILNSPYRRSKEAQALVAARVQQVREEGAGATATMALQRWFGEDFRNQNPDLMALLKSWILANKKEIYAENYQVLLDGVAEIAPLPKPIHCPTLVITGDEDYGNNPEMAALIAVEIPNANLVILPKLRHMTLAEAPELVNAALLNFLRINTKN